MTEFDHPLSHDQIHVATLIQMVLGASIMSIDKAAVRKSRKPRKLLRIHAVTVRATSDLKFDVFHEIFDGRTKGRTTELCNGNRWSR